MPRASRVRNEDREGREGEGDSLLQGDSSLMGQDMDIRIRHGFVRKVLLIVLSQLVITALIAWPIITHTSAAVDFFRAQPVLLYTIMFLPLVLMIMIVCCPHTFRKFPQNYIMLYVLTGCMGASTGIIAAQYTIDSMLQGLGITAILVVCLTAFAFQTKYDFTGWGPYLFVAMICMMIFGVLISCFWPGQWLRTVYCVGMVLLFSVYLVFDLQLVIGGKHHKFKYSIEDYCFAALSIYLDILQLFLHILELFGSRR